MLGKLKHLISLKNVYIFALDKEKEEILKVSRSLRFLFLSFFLFPSFIHQFLLLFSYSILTNRTSFTL